MPDVWGYARVSREDQQLDLQLDALEAAGVPRANIVEEKESGARQRRASTPCSSGRFGSFYAKCDSGR